LIGRENDPRGEWLVTNDRAPREGLAWQGIRIARRRPRLVIAAVAMMAAGLGTGLGLGLSGPGTPRWCDPVFSVLQIRGGSQHDFDSVLTALTRLESQDDAPVGKLVWDFQAQARSSGSYVALGNVVWDLQALGRDCGQPPGAFANYVT
jgi:hypothetical protein